jgi:transcriptional regulator with XRE-family HTH domain
MRSKYRIVEETTFASVLAKARAARGLSVRKLSEVSGVSPSTIYRLESGKTNIRFSSVAQLVVVLKIGIDLVSKENISPNGKKPISVIREPK